MPVPAPFLMVLPNPWTFIDHLGRPAGTCPCDPFEHRPNPGAKVGARVSEVKVQRAQQTRRIGGRETVAVPGDFYPIWEFETEPVRLPNTGYYRDRIRERELIPTDQRTAALAGVEWREPSELLDEIRSVAIREFDARNGDGAYAALTEETHATAEPQSEPIKSSSDKRSHNRSNTEVNE